MEMAPQEALTIVRSACKNVARALGVSDARCVFGEAFLTLTRARKTFDPSRNVPFSAYARRRIAGAVIDQLRRDTKPIYPRLYRPERESSDPAECVKQQELAQVALDSLPRDLRIVLFLHFYESLSLRRVAVCFGLSEARICQMHHEALQMLRQKLAA